MWLAFDLMRNWWYYCLCFFIFNILVIVVLHSLNYLFSTIFLKCILVFYLVYLFFYRFFELLGYVGWYFSSNLEHLLTTIFLNYISFLLSKTPLTCMLGILILSHKFLSISLLFQLFSHLSSSVQIVHKAFSSTSPIFSSLVPNWLPGQSSEIFISGIVFFATTIHLV